jgi:CubicO group peptidase (beta-lactamase class C family)
MRRSSFIYAKKKKHSFLLGVKSSFSERTRSIVGDPEFPSLLHYLQDKGMKRFPLFVAALLVGACGVAVAQDNGICQRIHTVNGEIDLNQAPDSFLSDAEFIGDSGGASAADLGIGLCRFFDSSNYPCRGHSRGHITLSAVIVGTPMCLTTFHTFTTPWFWNGESVQGELANEDNTMWASVYLTCGTNANGAAYNATVSEDALGVNFNITITTPYACPGKAPSHLCSPIETTSGGVIDFQRAPNMIVKNLPLGGEGANDYNVDLGIGLCSNVNRSGNACYRHPLVYFSVSSVTPDSQIGSGGAICLATFDTFLVPWYWNGTAVLAQLSGEDNSVWANAVLACSANETVTYRPIVSVDPSGTTFNITIFTSEVCVHQGTNPPTNHVIPFKTEVCTGKFCTEVPAFLTDAVAMHLAPGMSAAAIRLSAPRNSSSDAQWETLYLGTAGRFTYDDDAAKVDLNTLYDMASCTKVVTATTAAAQLYQLGLLALDAPVTTYLGSEYGRYGKDIITIQNLMLHNAGYPPDPNPGYSSPIFPCPENANYHPGQEFTCYHQIHESLMNQTLAYPVGSEYIYSDLSFITMAFVVGSIAKNYHGSANASTPALQKVANLQLVHPCSHEDNLLCWFHAYVVEFIFNAYGMDEALFIPNNAGVTPPQWTDPWYHHGLIWGYVSDQNAYAMGGISGHAGLFATVKDSIKVMKQWIAPHDQVSSTDPSVLSKATVELFTTVKNTTQSSRALGWDTMYDPATGQWCGTLSRQTFFHIGYTGTGLCGDPVNKVLTVILANGRYPDYRVDGMIEGRPIYNTLIGDLLEGTP